MLIGNETVGFSYASIDGFGSWKECGCPNPKAKFGQGEFSTLDEFFNTATPDSTEYLTHGARFKAAYRIKTELWQDVAAWFSMQESAGKPYNPVPNTSNCHESVSNALQAAGIPTPSYDITPEQFYFGLTGITDGAHIRFNEKDISNDK